MKIAVFYHGLFFLNGEPSLNCINVVHSQMETFRESGLLDSADEFHIGINGGEESEPFAESILPAKATKVYHGLNCRTEIRTLMHLQNVMRGRAGWKVLYLHAKGASHSPDEKMINNWRQCMMHNLVTNWLICINSLNSGFDSAGCHWKREQVDGTMSLWGGNFFWATSDFLNTLPPIESHPRIAAQGGVDDFRSRYESEVWIGSGRRLPKVRDYHPSGPFNCGGG